MGGALFHIETVGDQQVVGDGDAEGEDDDPLEAAAMHSAYASRIQVEGEADPCRNGEDDLRVRTPQIFAWGTEKPDSAHAQSDREEEEPATGAVEGDLTGRVEGGQVVIQPATLQGTTLQQIHGGTEEGEGETNVTSKGDEDVHAPPGISPQHRPCIFEAHGHQQGIEQAEEGDRCEEEG